MAVIIQRFCFLQRSTFSHKILSSLRCSTSISCRSRCCDRQINTVFKICRSLSILRNVEQRQVRFYSRFVDGLVLNRVKRKPPWNVLFFGTDEYALTHLKSLNENRIAGDVKVVDLLEVCVPKSNCPVRSYSQENMLHTYDWPLPAIDVNRYDVGVVVSFGHLIPKRVINLFPYGILNVHPSILPRWRGASPIIHTLLNDDKETGISVMQIRPIHFDVGPLLLQVKYAVPESCTAFQLRDYLAQEGSSLLMQALHELVTLEKMEYEQHEYGITYAHKLNPINARVNWEMQSPSDIDRQYRALSELFGLKSRWRNLSVRLNDMIPLEDMSAGDICDALDDVFPDHLMTVRPGIAFYHNKREILCIRCKDGWVGFQNITIKKLMTAKSFYNGYLSKPEYRATAFDSQKNDLDRYMFRTVASHAKVSTVERLYSIRARR